MRTLARLGFVALPLAAPAALAEDAAPLAALGSLPIREVSVFKDGHAFVLREGTMPAGASPSPAWWGWFNWPAWWHRMNGAGRIAWKVTVAPHATTTLTYRWHYLWQ